MNIWLLTHSEERKKASGTGILVKNTLKKNCHIIEWSRVSPSENIISLPVNNTVLIYPEESTDVSEESTDIIEESTDIIEESNGITERKALKDIDHIIILDGTWQQARKMYNQSPYLKRFIHYEIKGESSRYSKRRNQKKTGLCTAEVAIYYLRTKGHEKADLLQASFDDFNQ